MTQNDETKAGKTGVDPIECPNCGSGGSYQLADGRRQCRDCRKKYSSRITRQPLGDGFRAEAARLFWEMVPARRAALILGTNRKTMQRYYGLIRHAIAREQATDHKSNPLEGSFSFPSFCDAGAPRAAPKHPVFWLLQLPERLQVVFPENGSIVDHQRTLRNSVLAVVVVYAPGIAELENLALDRFRQRIWWHGEFSPDKTVQPRLERFWMFAKDRLRHYRGGYQANFPFFVREMVFRFSEQNNQKALAFLRRSLENEIGVDQNFALEEKNS